MMVALLALVAVGGLFALFAAWPPVPQDPAYHVMADERSLLGIPNALNVLSNVPFAVLGVMGLGATFGARSRHAFQTPWERWPWAVLFSGVTLTAFGSAYYHLAPDNARLVWDRLPMALGFTGLLTMVVAERIGPRAARIVFGPLVVLGLGSVIYWYRTELAGAGDLRPYAVVQFGSLAAVAVLLAVRSSRYTGTPYLVAALAAYAASKVLELADRQIFALGEIVSGHTLKHLAAGLGAALLVAMLRARAETAADPSERFVYTRGGQPRF